jgi:hypothetical protein
MRFAIYGSGLDRRRDVTRLDKIHRMIILIRTRRRRLTSRVGKVGLWGLKKEE